MIHPMPAASTVRAGTDAGPRPFYRLGRAVRCSKLSAPPPPQSSDRTTLSPLGSPYERCAWCEASATGHPSAHPRLSHLVPGSCNAQPFVLFLVVGSSVGPGASAQMEKALVHHGEWEVWLALDLGWVAMAAGRWLCLYN